MHDEIYTKNNGNHDTKVRKIKIFHTCNYCFVSEFASPSVHTIVLPKYRFDLQIACWSFTEITFLDPHQTELFSRWWKFLACFVYDFLNFNTTEIAEKSCALRRSVSVSMKRGRVFLLIVYWASSQTLSSLKPKQRNLKNLKSRKNQFMKKPGQNFRRLRITLTCCLLTIFFNVMVIFRFCFNHAIVVTYKICGTWVLYIEFCFSWKNSKNHKHSNAFAEKRN